MFITPQRNDVLSGRGNGVKNHPGNVHYRELVSVCRCDYVQFPKEKKYLVSHIIHDEIRNLHPPGRFLKEQDKGKGNWIELTQDEVHTKITQALREDQPEQIIELASRQEFTLLNNTEIEEACIRIQKTLKDMTDARNQHILSEPDPNNQYEVSSIGKSTTDIDMNKQLSISHIGRNITDRQLPSSPARMTQETRVITPPCSVEASDPTFRHANADSHIEVPYPSVYKGTSNYSVQKYYERQMSCLSLNEKDFAFLREPSQRTIDMLLECTTVPPTTHTVSPIMDAFTFVKPDPRPRTQEPNSMNLQQFWEQSCLPRRQNAEEPQDKAFPSRAPYAPSFGRVPIVQTAFFERQHSCASMSIDDDIMQLCRDFSVRTLSAGSVDWNLLEDLPESISENCHE